MTRRSWRISACAMAVLAAMATVGAQDRPLFRSTSQAVRVDVSVQQNGRPVSGLTTADFEVTDNGVVQSIADFSFEKLPIDVSVALDISESVSGEILKRLQLGVEQLQQRLTPQDRLKVVAFNMRVKRLFDFADPNADTKLAFAGVTATGTTAILDTVSVLLAAPADADRRHLIIVFSDGADTSSLTDRDIMLAVARRTTVAVTFVQPFTTRTQLTGGLASSGALGTGFPQSNTTISTTVTTGKIVAPVLSELAAETGGVVLQPAQNDDLTKVFANVLDDFRSSYVLNFIPRGVSDHGLHGLEVRVTKSGKYAIRARKSYVAD